MFLPRFDVSCVVTDKRQHYRILKNSGDKHFKNRHFMKLTFRMPVNMHIHKMHVFKMFITAVFLNIFNQATMAED